jgi:predicted nucleotidyltransferase
LLITHNRIDSFEKQQHEKNMTGAEKQELESLRKTIERLKTDGKVSIAIVYGSYATGTPHSRSDIDLAIYLKAENDAEEMELADQILMATETDVSILRLDDEDESPFVVQEALKGIHLVDPDLETLYAISHRVLHECEGIRFRRMLSVGQY